MDDDYFLNEATEIVEERERVLDAVEQIPIDWDQFIWVCEACGETNHIVDLAHCKNCGA